MPSSLRKKEHQCVPSSIRNIILDLDETLISAIEIPELERNSKKQTEFQERQGAFRVHKMDKEYMIVERPHVQTFLDYVFKHYNVSVWTAASKEYAIFVLQNVILRRPNRKLDFFLYAENCDASYERTGCLKQLNQLFHLPRYNPTNTMIIDDNRNVSENQTNYVWQIHPFRFFHRESTNDRYLLEILEKMKSNSLPNK